MSRSPIQQGRKRSDETIRGNVDRGLPRGAEEERTGSRESQSPSTNTAPRVRNRNWLGHRVWWL